MASHVRSRDTVVSFNYDTIFEQSIQGRQRPYYDCVEPKPAHGIRLLKPHGSINWQLANGQIVVANHPARSVIVAPTHLKFVARQLENEHDAHATPAYGYLDQTGTLAAIWSQMEAQMKEARALAFIGYSFPVADLYFSSVLRSVLGMKSAPPTIVVVNPNAMEISRRIRIRFSLPHVETFFDFDQFNRRSRIA